jgi:integrase
MRGHIAQKRGRFYLVFDVGRDPRTGRRKQRWHSGPDRKGYTSKRQAERALRGMLTNVDQGGYVDPSKVTVGEFLERWLPTQRLRPSTMEVYRVQLAAYVLPRIGTVRLQELTAETLDALYADLERSGGRGSRPLSPKTVRNVHVMIHRALERATARNLIPRNPAAQTEKPKAKRPEMRPWTVEETERFLRASEGNRLHAAYLVMATTGLRRGEVLGLTWADVNLDEARLSVQRALVLVGHVPTISAPKTAASRRGFPLSRQAVAALRAHRKAQAAERLVLGEDYANLDLVFAQEDGSMVHPDRFLNTFHRIAARAGLRRTRPHDLRHGWATRALEAGIPAKVVQELLGHSSAMVTLDIYSHVTASLKSNASQVVADLVTGKR